MIKIGKVPLFQLVKAVALVSSGPVLVIAIYAALERIEINHAIYAIIAIMVIASFFVHPSIENVISLTDYVTSLANDERSEEPDLSYLNTVEELSASLKALNLSWENKQRQLENAVAENKIVVEILPDALIMADNHLKIVRTNGTARKLFGQRLGQRNVEEVFSHIPELMQAINSVSEGDIASKDVEFSYPDQINRDFRAQIKKFPIHSFSGAHLMITMHDLTELRRMRKMRADFVANASHEMKTPLASIMGFIETLQGPAKDDEKARTEFLGMMQKQGERMKRLINDLLSLSRIEANVDVPEELMDLNEILIKTKEDNDWFAKQSEVNITYKKSKIKIPIVGDKDELSQVFYNLVENAIKYGNNNSTVKIEVTRTSKLLPELVGKCDEAIIVSVIDNGKGIDEKHIPRLTERFYRTDPARQGGTGLGLAIVKHILKRHNAALRIESKLGVGSTFSVHVPIPDKELLNKIQPDW